MNAKQESLITVLDAGSAKSVVLVAELQDGVLRYRGHGIEHSKGMRKGLIAELGPAAEPRCAPGPPRPSPLRA